MARNKKRGGSKKVIPQPDFQLVWDLYGNGFISQNLSAKMLRVSIPTFLSWRNEVINTWADWDKCSFIWENARKGDKKYKMLRIDIDLYNETVLRLQKEAREKNGNTRAD